MSRDEVQELNIGALISEINRELKKRFGGERLFFQLIKQTPSGPGASLEGAIIDSTGRLVAEHVLIEAAVDEKNQISLSGPALFEVPREDIETLMSQLASFPNPAISLHYAYVQNTPNAEEKKTAAEVHSYVFKAEREGRHFLYLEKTSGNHAEPALEEKWVFPVIVGNYPDEQPEGAIVVKNGDVFAVKDLERRVKEGQKTADYRWLKTSELLEWREEEIQRVRRSIEDVFTRAKMPAELDREKLGEGSSFLGEIQGQVKELLLSFRQEMIGLGFVTEGAAAPEGMQKLEAWADERMNVLYEKLMKTPVRMDAESGRLLVPVGDLIDLLDLEIEQYYKSRHNLKGDSILFPILTPEIASEWNAAEGDFHFDVFLKEQKEREAGPSSGDLRRLIFSLLDQKGSFILSKGAVSPTLFSLALHGVDERILELIRARYLDEAEKNRKKTEGVDFTLRGITIIKATRNWPASVLEAEVPYEAGEDTHTASVRIERSGAGYEVKVLSIGTPFTDEFLAKTRTLLEKYLPARLAGGLSAVYYEHGGFRGASFSVNGRSYIAELVRGEDGIIEDILIFGDYTGDGIIDNADHSKSRELMAEMDEESLWFLTEIREHDKGVQGFFFRNKEPVLYEWLRTETGSLNPVFSLSSDVTGDGVLFFDDLTFAVEAMKDAESLTGVIVNGTDPDYDANGVVDEKDASYAGEVYFRLGKVFSLLSRDQKEVLDINKDGKASFDDGRVLKETAINELTKKRMQQDLVRLNTEALSALESILAIPAFPDQNLDGLLDPADGVLTAKHLVILKVHADRLKELRRETSSLLTKFPKKARRLQETLVMLDEYIETASLTQDKLRSSLEEIRLGPPDLSSQELENGPPPLTGSLTRDLSLSKSPSR